MARMIFINLPVTDLARSTAFYEALGAEMNPAFSNENACMMVLSDTIHVMLMTHPFYASFSPKPIADAHSTSQMLLCLSADSRAHVDQLLDAARAAGGKTDRGLKQGDHPMMYGRDFEDPDGHAWEVMWMDPAAMQAAQASQQAEF